MGLVAALVVVGYLAWVSVKRRSVKIHGWRLELPDSGSRSPRR